jgi:putative FmdB family regulatory protein
MPTYEYECPNCGHQFASWRPPEKRKYAPCNVCGRNANKVIRTAPGVSFKGKGWTPKFHGGGR